jgi:RimJ/RimL family protein N-acetyltransferase
MDFFLTLEDAMAKYVHDGASVGLEGFTHLIPFAAGSDADTDDAGLAACDALHRRNAVYRGRGLRRLLRYVGHWAVLGFGYWVVEEKASGEFVGETGFADYRREMKPSLDGAPEIGWVLTPRFHA